MLTQCPGCQTVFRVTGTILRAAHGQVRCGRCNTQFDAIEYLQEEEPSEQTQSGAATENSAPSESQSNEFVSAAFDQDAVQHEEITLEGNRIEISGIYRSHEPSSEQPIAEHTHTVIEEFNIDSEEWQNPFEESVDAPSAEESASAAALSQALASLDSDAGEPHAHAEIVPFVITGHARGDKEIAEDDIEFRIDEVQDELEDEQATYESTDEQMDVAADDVAAPSPLASAASKSVLIDANTLERAAPGLAHSGDERISTSNSSDSFAELVDASQSPRRWLWMALSGALILWLAVQALHHYRQTLVRHPTFGPPLTDAYHLLGLSVEPHWDVSAYNIKQWGIVSDPQAPGTLRVRASITNNATFAQPYPLLKLTLEDRFGVNVGTREFAPGEYLPNPIAATRRLDANAAANIDLAIVDPGEDAVGFQLNVCVQHADGMECTG